MTQHFLVLGPAELPGVRRTMWQPAPQSPERRRNKALPNAS